MNRGRPPHIQAPQWNMGGMDETEIPLPRVLQNAGYRTITVGKAHFAPPSRLFSNPIHLGFDVNIAGSSIGQPGSYRSQDNFGFRNLPRPGLGRIPYPGHLPHE